MDVIYLDNNATTPLLPAVWEAMRPFSLEHAANPASSHRAGRKARQALEDARERIAECLGAQGDEVVFTSGATEANNLAVFGLVGDAVGRIVTSPLEHPCVSEPVAQLAAGGYSHTSLPVNEIGTVRTDTDFLSPDTRLVAVMLANHETGAVQPVEELARTVAGTEGGEHFPFHCDAAAAAGKIAIDFRGLGVTSMVVSAHKFHGPKGIGVLVVKKGARLRPMLWGGHQQQARRPGTEPVALAVGMATALEIATRDLEVNHPKVLKLRQLLLHLLRSQAAPVVLNGPEESGIPHTLNLSFPGCRADVLLMNLDLEGVACSAGSACSSGSLLPSPVLRAMNLPADRLHSAVRFSLSPLLGPEHIEEAARRIAKVINNLRSLQEEAPGL
jgi:cysteine desulfurase